MCLVTRHGRCLTPREGISAFCTATRTCVEMTMADDLNRDGVENQIKGVGNEIKGKARNAVGGLTGDSSEQLKGKAEELKGKAQRKIGETETDLDDGL